MINQAETVFSPEKILQNFFLRSYIFPAPNQQKTHFKNLKSLHN